MFGLAKRPEPEPQAEPAIVEVLQRLWQTKLKSVRLLERWRAETTDSDIEVGLTAQLVDERLHLRLLGEQLRRLGVKLNASSREDALSHLFDDIQASGSDVRRLLAFYRGIKAHTLKHCGYLIPVVDRALAAALDRIVLDDERHVRWADFRIRRLLTREAMRDCNVLLDRVHKGLETIWGRSWKHFVVTSSRRSA